MTFTPQPHGIILTPAEVRTVQIVYKLSGAKPALLWMLRKFPNQCWTTFDQTAEGKQWPGFTLGIYKNEPIWVVNGIQKDRIFGAWDCKIVLNWLGLGVL